MATIENAHATMDCLFQASAQTKRRERLHCLKLYPYKNFQKALNLPICENCFHANELNANAAWVAGIAVKSGVAHILIV